MTNAADLRARAADDRQQVLDLGPSLAQRPPQPTAPGAASQPIAAALLASAPERIDWTPRPMRVGSEDRFPLPEFVPDPHEHMLDALRAAVGQPYLSAPLPPHWAVYRWQRYECAWARHRQPYTVGVYETMPAVVVAGSLRIRVDALPALLGKGREAWIRSGSLSAEDVARVLASWAPPAAVGDIDGARGRATTERQIEAREVLR